jgi:tRNA(Ile2) C34 agmatinyltransferase TiaS
MQLFLNVEEVCERPEAGTCEKCGAAWEQGCQIGEWRCRQCGGTGSVRIIYSQHDEEFIPCPDCAANL